jgi:hypothetical protein
LCRINSIGNQLPQEDVVFTVKELFDDWKDVLSLDSDVSLLHNLVLLPQGQNRCQIGLVTGWHSFRVKKAEKMDKIEGNTGQNCQKNTTFAPHY